VCVVWSVGAGPTVDKEKEKEALGLGGAKRGLKLDRAQEQLKAAGRRLAALQARSGMAVAVVLFAMVFVVSALSVIACTPGVGSYVRLTAHRMRACGRFGGQVVAKLPFHPVSLLTPLTHRGLVTADMTDCSPYFIYMLTSLALRATVRRALGLEVRVPGQDFATLFAPPTAAGPGGSGAW
jgi:hypothetical protein